mgnify:FL=1|tara:strand:+ start:42 stop:680 length:639 start_codon:yes stop_codon:yes gene_type:complete
MTLEGIFGPEIGGSILLFAGLLVTYKEPIKDYIKSHFENHSQLIDHDLFSVINECQITRLMDFRFEGDKIKTKILRDLLEIKLRCIEEETKKFLESKDIKKKDHALYKKAEDLLNTIVERHNKEWLERFKNKGLSEEDIEFIMKSFNDTHLTTIKNIRRRMKSIFYNGYYVTSYQKLTAMLEVFAMAVEFTFDEGIEAFEKMNGRFKDIDYK